MFRVLLVLIAILIPQISFGRDQAAPAATATAIQTNPETERRNFCRDPKNVGKGLTYESYNECMQQEARYSRDSDNGDSCDILLKDYNKAQSDAAGACVGLGSSKVYKSGVSGAVGRTDSSRTLNHDSCQSRVNAIEACENQYSDGGAGRRTYKDIGEADGDCKFMRGLAKEDYKDRLKTSQENFNKYDDARQKAEEDYFKVEEEMLEKAEKLKLEMQQAQEEAEEALSGVEAELQEIKRKTNADTTAAKTEVEKTRAQLESLQIGPAQDEFLAQVELLNAECKQKGQAAVDAEKERIRKLKSVGQYKYQSSQAAQDILNSAYNKSNSLNAIGTKAESLCKMRDTNYIGKLRAAQNKMTAVREQLKLAQTAMQNQLSSLETSLQQIDLRGYEDSQAALKRANTRWQSKMKRVNDLSQQYALAMQTAQRKQLKAAADIDKYTKKALAEEKKIERDSRLLDGMGGYSKEKYDKVSENKTKAGVALEEIARTREQALSDKCCLVPGKYRGNICPSSPPADGPKKPFTEPPIPGRDDGTV